MGSRKREEKMCFMCMMKNDFEARCTHIFHAFHTFAGYFCEIYSLKMLSKDAINFLSHIMVEGHRSA